ncbi:MAG: hypothetical protein V3U15_05630 [Nitrospinota bacterium]
MTPISNGEIWMTRVAIASVFEEYVKMINPVRTGASRLFSIQYH